MIDVTQNTTPHGLLREIDPEAAAALEAWPHGVQCWRRNGWEKIDDPSWTWICVYRAIPAPVRVVRWANMYLSGVGASCETREKAERTKCDNRIAVLRIERDKDGSNVTVTVEAA